MLQRNFPTLILVTDIQEKGVPTIPFNRKTAYEYLNVKRTNLIIIHEYLRQVIDILNKHQDHGLTLFDLKGRGRAKNESVTVGREAMTDLCRNSHGLQR